VCLDQVFFLARLFKLTERQILLRNSSKRLSLTFEMRPSTESEVDSRNIRNDREQSNGNGKRQPNQTTPKPLLMQPLSFSSELPQNIRNLFLIQKAARENDFGWREVCSRRGQGLESPFLIGDAVEDYIAVVGEPFLVFIGRAFPGCPRCVRFVDDAIVVG
jgi:hypothetical protein